MLPTVLVDKSVYTSLFSGLNRYIIVIDKINSFVNKGLKYTLLAFVALFGVHLLTAESVPDEVNSAELELWSAYNEAHIYDQLTCQSGDVDGNWVVACFSNNGSSKGIYEVKVLGENQYRIYYVNGKAKTHTRKMGRPYTYNDDSTVSISKAMEKFS